MKTLAIWVAALIAVIAYTIVTLYAMWFGLVFALFGQWLYAGLLTALICGLIYLPFYITRKV